MSATARVIEGNCAAMSAVADGAVHLVVTSPPFLDMQTERSLRSPIEDRSDARAVEHGFRAFTRIGWIPTDRPRRAWRRSAKAPRLGAFRAPQAEFFVAMRRFEAPRRQSGPVVEEVAGQDFLAEPVWRTPGESHRPRHRHAGPPEVFGRLVALYSRPGDLVVDPFCGGGGVLAVARDMGRDAIGYDTDPRAVALAMERIGA